MRPLLCSRGGGQRVHLVGDDFEERRGGVGAGEEGAPDVFRSRLRFFFFFFPRGTHLTSIVYRKLLSNRKHLICTCI